MTNNNATGDFVISKQTFFWLMDTANGNGVNNQQFYIVNSVNLDIPILSMHTVAEAVVIIVSQYSMEVAQLLYTLELLVLEQEDQRRPH